MRKRKKWRTTFVVQQKEYYVGQYTWTDLQYCQSRRKAFKALWATRREPMVPTYPENELRVMKRKERLLKESRP